VRTDLPLADQIVQVGHACLEAGVRFGCRPDRTWHLVVLGVPNLLTLDAYARACRHAGLAAVIFDEPDDGLGHTALCSAPLTREAGRLFRRLRLWRSPG
jgi:hypothetical protein